MPTLTTGCYPRVCGGAGQLPSKWIPVTGLSPRVRGSHGGWARPRRRERSIPVCAGEPSVLIQSPRAQTVYPRVCGGSPAGGDGARTGAGSIPACAGEPLFEQEDGAKNPVYPRVCGGAVWAGNMTADNLGLSPRVRGSQGDRQARPADRGSIPACAGEPTGR